MSVSTHVLDNVTGAPAAGVAVCLDQATPHGWSEVGRADTDDDGRVRELAGGGLAAGTYRLTFEVGAYFERRGTPAFYPEVAITFRVSDPGAHHHVPLLLSPFAYATYRGS